MEQESLFHEDIYDALRTCIQALGGNQIVGHQLWPAKTPSKAGETLSDCLNRDRPYKLDAEQIIWILAEARKINCHAGMFFIALMSDYEEPKPVDPEDKKAKLQREFNQQVKNLEGLIQQIQRNDSNLKAVS